MMSATRENKRTNKQLIICKQIVKDLEKKNYNTYELRMKYGIEEASFSSILVQLTYVAPVYEYKIGGKVYLGLMQQ